MGEPCSFLFEDVSCGNRRPEGEGKGQEDKPKVRHKG